jgi:putative addiction module component (TIGR02574 family)
VSTSFEALQSEVLRLPPADRTRLLERLIVSLDADTETEAAWDAIADAREQELQVGGAQGVPLEDALARLEARFKA